MRRIQIKRNLKTKRQREIRNKNAAIHMAVAIISCLFIVAIMQWDRSLFKAEFREGDIALRTIYAPFDFRIKGEINTPATEEAREKAMETILPVYVLDPKIEDNVIDKAGAIVESVKKLKDNSDLTEEERAKKLKDIAAEFNLSEAVIYNILGLNDPSIFLDRVKEIVSRFMNSGIISSSEKTRLKDSDIDTVKLIHQGKDVETEVSVGSFFTLEDLKNRQLERVVSSLVKDRGKRSVITDFVNSILTVNVSYDRERTEARRRVEAQKVKPVFNIIEVKRNEMILNKGERIGKEDIAKLRGMEQSEPSSVRIGGIVAATILVGLLLLLLGLYMRFYEPELLARNKELVLLAIICVLILFATKVIVISPWPSNLAPVAVSSMLIAILIDSRLAIITTCLLSILVGMVSGNRLDIAGLSLIGGIIGIVAMKGVRRRSQLIAAGLCVGLANMSYLISIGLLRALSFNTYITESLFGFANGMMSAVIVTGILPIFENTFKITTDISLLELADLNHPLLKEMVVKAPGTYHHSLVVGNLAEAACEAIGANSLLARVASYFHDIGKIEKASYFSENQPDEKSMHDKLSPTMSSLIITNHVKNGIDLARKYSLNSKIIDIIKQHHGTGLVFYFFKRALEKVTDEEVGEQAFRYPGPKPQTKEAACVLLADSVEAASRALDDPTPSRIKGLVRKIINNKFIDGQLDECDLTLKDLEKIAEVFTHILTGIFHTRVGYPEEPQSE